MAKVIQAFKGCHDGSPRVTDFQPGDQVEGDLARVAIQEGWAEDPEKRASSAKAKVAEGDEGDGAGDDAPAKEKASSGGKAGKGK